MSEYKLSDLEQSKRDRLKNEKPDVYAKIMAYKDKFARGEAIPNLQYQADFRCNFNCTHCSVEPLMKIKYDKRVEIEDIRKLCIEADSLGLANFIITGGEGLLIKDLDKLVKAINPKKFWIVLDSNGWLLTKEKAKYLKELGIDKVQISIDSLDAKEHDAFRNKTGSFDRCIDAIDNCLDADLIVNVATVVTKQRVRSQELLDYLQYMTFKGVDTFISFAKPVGAWEGNFDALVDKDDLNYIKSLEGKYRVMTHLTSSFGFNIGCLAVKKMISIIPSGDVLPCPYMYVSLGNILKESLKDIIDRGMNIKYFGEYQDTCLMAEDRHFIDEYLVKRIYGEKLPVPWGNVFLAEDLIK